MPMPMPDFQSGIIFIMKIDLHNHSFYSEDSSLNPDEAIERAIELGFDGIAFTEHNSFEASEPVERLREKYEGRFLILRGAEYNAAEGHMLVFGIKKDIFINGGLYAPIVEMVRIVNESGGVVIVPHPFREWSLLNADIKKIPGIHAIETYNGHNNEAENEKAVEVASALGLPTTGGSDAHHLHEVGCCYTEFFSRITADNFLDSLRTGNYRGHLLRA